MSTVRLFAGLAAVSVLGLSMFPEKPMAVRADSAAAKEIAPQPVEDDMHEFMEYVFEPTYKRLKATMSADARDNSAWKAIKSDALILSEGGNLLLLRTPEEDAEAWSELSAAVRELGGNLYQAAKTKDSQHSANSYRAMLRKCNACHQKFAEGEHQLTP